MSADTLRLALAELREQRDTIDLAIVNLERLLGPDALPPSPLGETKPRTARRAAVSKKRRTLEQAVGRAASRLRDEAILKYLRLHERVATIEQIRSGFPREPGHSSEQRESALRNALQRLKAKKLVARTGKTWSLVGAASE